MYDKRIRIGEEKERREKENFGERGKRKRTGKGAAKAAQGAVKEDNGVWPTRGPSTDFLVVIGS